MNSSYLTPPFSEDPEEPQEARQPQPAQSPRRQSTPRRSITRGRVGNFGIFNGLQVIITYAFLAATLFTLFTPNNLFSGQMVERLFSAWQANPTSIAQVTAQAPVDNSANRIGIVAGHWKNDSGAVCPDGLTEQSVNLKIATLVQQKLTAEGYTVDLLAEFDERLTQYKAIALVSIHNDSCDYINDQATGFKVAAAMHSAYPDKASRLTACLIDRYHARTGLAFHANSITNDMTNYHAFDEINTDTTAAIIETGFLNLDRKILTENTDLVAQGVVDGINCFIRNESISPTATVTP
jgi:N-acetylmuramoyl-L-alanine amidase